jgi:hypothetical protein
LDSPFGESACLPGSEEQEAATFTALNIALDAPGKSIDAKID